MLFRSATVDTSSITASVTVYIEHGSITAVILGGDTRSAPVDQVLVLDASNSIDADLSPTAVSTLSYQVE